MVKKRIENDKVEAYVVEDFLTDVECEKLIDRINQKASRSKVMGGEAKEKAKVSNFRTSYTSNMNQKQFPYVAHIDRKISRTLGVPLQLGEVTQGQRYDVGQEFKDHTDYFGKSAMKGHGDRWGNRVWTFMIYLNEDCIGGETDFKRAKLKFKPKKGMAVIWRNIDENGKPNPYSMHAGRPVKSGVKYIITKWFREKPTGSYPLDKFFKSKYPHLVPTKNKIVPATEETFNKEAAKIFTRPEDFPSFTETGFKLIDIPPNIWSLIQTTYKHLKKSIKKEKFPNQLKTIHDAEKKESPVDIMQLSAVPHVKKKLHYLIKPILEEWAGVKIEPTMIYGIRSYKDGAILVNHVDRIKTHHISAIIIVDEKSNKPWPLDIKSHDGEWHKVYAKPGQMILYESLSCMHGRTEEFDGEYFRNFFVHYKVPDWTYKPELMNRREKRSEVKRPNLYKKEEVTV